MAQWIHFIGICGTATGQIAVEFKRNGFLVSGSEKGLYPPMSEHIKQNGIGIEIGYKDEHLTLDYYKNKYGGEWQNHEKQFPDEVVYVGTKGNVNPEYLFAKDNQIPIKFYPTILKERVVVPDHSIVVAGTYGKTTITSMLAWIFSSNGVDVSYMFGGLNPNLKNGARFKNENTKFSVIEGDEYMISPTDLRSKFFEYSPKYLILTSAQWDHADMFKTKEEYLFNFKNLIDTIPEDGLIIYDENDSNITEFIISNTKCEKIPYTSFELEYNSTNTDSRGLNLKVIGEHNQRNALAAFGMAKKLGESLGITTEKITNSLGNYLGLRRRLEIKHKSDNLMVIDDFGSTPHKAKVALASLNTEFPDKSIYVVFEPNIGSRTARSINEYQNTFDSPNVKKIFLPRFSNVKGDFFDNNKLAEYLKLINVPVEAISDDNVLVEAVADHAKGGGIIVFMGSHGFRGMIDKVVKKFT